MPDSFSVYPRAYVAAPVAPANGLFQAIHWAFGQDEDLGWRELGILVPAAASVHELGHLQRLRSRGVRIGTAAQAARARSFHGVMIAYCPDAAMLVVAEQVLGVRGVVAVAGDNEQLLEWVASQDPQHLGGQVLIPAPAGEGLGAGGSRRPLQPTP